MTSMPNTLPGRRLTGTQWAICIVAAIGFAFDTYELLMLPLVIKPALLELSKGTFLPGSDGFKHWASLLFYVPAVCGGIFGLLGGYLTDWFGRRRVLTWSILMYAGSAFLAGFSTSLEMLLVLRCFTFVGVCVEFVAATAWLAELFDEPRQREKVLGYTQAFASVGGLLVALMFGLIVKNAEHLPAIVVPGFLTGLLGAIAPENQHAAWRYTLMSGLIPALPLIVIRPWLPESPKWLAQHTAGTLRRPSILELFSPALRRTTIVSTIMVAAVYGAAFGAIQMIPQLMAGVPQVKQDVGKAIAAAKESPAWQKKVAEAATPEAAKKVEGMLAKQTGAPIEQTAAASMSKVQELGGLAGRVLLAVLAVYVVSRQRLIRIFQIPALLVMPVVFGWCAVTDLRYLYVGIFFAGLLTVGQFSFWGNYLPRVYPVHLRGTGESFAANVGGRLIGTSFFAVTQWLAPMLPVKGPVAPEHKLAYAAAVVGLFVGVVGIVAGFFLPEPKSESLAE